MSRNLLSRRIFLQKAGVTAAAGVAISTAPANLAESSSAQPAPFILDCQSHLYMPDLVARMEKRKEDPTVYTKDGARYVKMRNWRRKILPKHMDVAAKLTDMDANGITMTAISINDPGPEWFGDDGPAIAQAANDFIAGLVREHPGRFIGLCVLPWQDVAASLAELDRCIVRLGMKGILLYTNLAGRFGDEPQFRPIFKRAVELDAPFLIHPALPVTSDQVEAYEMISSLGNMFDDTIILTRIIMSGMLDEMPKLKIICPHLGGTLPYIIGRLDHQTQVLKRGPKYLTKAPSEYLKQVYLDIVSPQPPAMKLAYDLMGSDRLVFGSDHPWVDPKLILDCLRSLKLPPEEERKILGANAKKIFRI